jgi:hypothetical protein
VIKNQSALKAMLRWQIILADFDWDKAGAGGSVSSPSVQELLRVRLAEFLVTANQEAQR